MGAPPTLPQAGSCPACPTCVSSSYLASFSPLYKVKLLQRHCTGITPKVLLKYSRNTCVSSSYLASFSLHSSTTPKILQKYIANTSGLSLSLYSMILQKTLVYLPHIGIFLPSPYKVQLLRRYCNDITPKVLLKYSRNTCVSSSYLASFFLHSTTTPKIHQKYSFTPHSIVLQQNLSVFLIFGSYLSPLYKVQLLSKVL